MQTGVVVKDIQISKRGQLVFFQINVPKDIGRVIGVELGIKGLRELAAADIIGRQLVGVVKLQAENTNNICYSAPVHVGISSVEQKIIGFNPVYTRWQRNLHIGCVNKEPDPVLIKGSHMLYGSFKDEYGKRISRDLVYTVSLCLWVGMKETSDDTGDSN